MVFLHRFSISVQKVPLEVVPDLSVPQAQFPGPRPMEVEFFWNFLVLKPFLYDFAPPVGT